ncbi:MAG: hypothetical protein V1729_05965 [Candidatus Woesearchaeota archaeon]
MSNTIYVQPWKMETIDFSVHDEAQTHGLEQCIAIATRKGDKGTLAHLTLKNNLREYFQWLVNNAERDSELYLAGGRPVESQSYIRKVIECVKKIGYDLTAHETMKDNISGCDLMMRQSGPIALQYYRRFGSPSGEKKLPVSISMLGR